MSSTVQSVLVPKTFSQSAATLWVESHGYKAPKIDITPDYFRFRQELPSKFRRFTSQKLDNGVLLILGWH